MSSMSQNTAQTIYERGWCQYVIEYAISEKTNKTWNELESDKSVLISRKKIGNTMKSRWRRKRLQ